MAAISTIDLSDLRSQFRGALVEPGDSGWDASREAFNLTFDQQPMLIAFPVDSADVQVLVTYAAARGIELAPQRTGHNAEPLVSLADMILVKTDAMRGVEIDVERRVARVLSGTKWADVVPYASDLGLAALHGSTPDVSVVGYSLGGGVGWYARKLGLATNSVLAIEVVTPDGRFRRVDARHDADLFWAMRGGGGNFGIVTAIEIQLYPIAEVYAGVLFFPWERSSEVLQAWREWTETVPDEVTSVGRILQIPPIEEVPEFLRGQNFVVVEATILGDQAFGDAQMAPLRALGPIIDTFAMQPPVGISELHMDPPTPLPYAGGGHVLASALTPEVIEDFVAVTGPGSGSTLISAEIRHTGGELVRPNAAHGALSTLPGEYMTFGVGLVVDAASAQAVRGTLAAMEELFEPVDTGRRYLNFVEEPTDPARFYDPEAYARLRHVKAVFDPYRIIRANHPIKPAIAATC
jgi:FAD/FMN-containing dehydrogenase